MFIHFYFLVSDRLLACNQWTCDNPADVTGRADSSNKSPIMNIQLRDDAQNEPTRGENGGAGTGEGMQ